MTTTWAVQIDVTRVPMSKMFGYATDIRNRTKELGTFVMELCRYEEVPHLIAIAAIDNKPIPSNAVRRRAS